MRRKPEDGWKELYKLALLEPDRAKVPVRIADAHAAISQQLAYLSSSPSCAEYTALKNAKKSCAWWKKRRWLEEDRLPRKIFAGSIRRSLVKTRGHR